jgi:hypothetical protein
MDTWVRDKVSLELCQIHIEGTIKTERSRDGRNNLTNQSVKIGISWPFNVQVTTADIVNSLVVYHEGAIGMFQGSVGGEDGVIGLDHGSGHLRGRIDTELQLGLFAIINGETFHEK